MASAVFGRSSRQLMPLLLRSCRAGQRHQHQHQQQQMRRRLHNLGSFTESYNRATGFLASLRHSRIERRNASSSSSSSSSSRIDSENRVITVNWCDGASASVLPIAWLRDNCQCEKCFHPGVLARQQLMENFNPKIDVVSVSLNDADRSCRVTWSDGHISDYNYDWLRRRSFDAESQAVRARWYSGKHKLWDATHTIARHDYGQIMNSEETLLKFLNDMEAFGLVVIENSPPPAESTASTVTDLCNRVAYPMQNNYGDTFEVKSKLDPSNLAYTPVRLGLHIDLPYYREPPGIQMLHCVSQSDNILGGENFFTDGFHAATLLKSQDPQAFKTLTTTSVDFYDYGTDFLKDFHLLCKQRVITVDQQGEYEKICYNNQVRDTYLNIPVEQVQNFYDSLKIFDTLLHGDQCAVFTKLKTGEIVVFDNRRVLHGRNKYEVVGTAERHLQGAYLRWDEAYSRIRRLEESVRGMKF